MTFPKSLYDYGGTVNENVDFSIKPDKSGIDLKAFDLEGRRMRVVRTIQYKPFNFGFINPGAGQIGDYEIQDEQEKKYLAKIKDYRAMEGDWKIHLEALQEL